MIEWKKKEKKSTKKKKVGFWIGSTYPILMRMIAFWSPDVCVYKSENAISFWWVDQKLSTFKQKVYDKKDDHFDEKNIKMHLSSSKINVF